MPERKKEEDRIKVRLPLKDINIRILVFAVLVAATALLLRPVQIRLEDRMERLKEDLIGRAEEFWGRTIQYGSMGPSIFGVLDIRDVLVLREDDSVFLGISRLRFSFSVIEFLRGNVHDAFRSVRIDRPVLNLDLEKDADIGEKLASMRVREGAAPSTGTVRQALDLIPERFSLRVWNGEWDLSGRSGVVKFRGVGFDASVRQNRVSFQGRWNAQGALAGNSFFSNLFSGAGFSPGSAAGGNAGSTALQALMTGRISGEYLADIEEGSAELRIPSVSGDFFRFRPVNLSAFLSGNRLEIRKAYDRSPVTFSFIYNFAENRLQGHFEGENFSPEALLTFTGPLRDYNPVLNFRISGIADFERERSGALRYTANFSGTGADSGAEAETEQSFLEQAFLDIDLFGTEELVTVNSFDVRSPFGRAAFRGGVNINADEFIPAAPFGSLSLSNFRFRGGRGISGDFSLTSGERETALSSANLTAGGARFSSLDISLNWESGGLAFSASALRYGARGSASPDGARLNSFSLSGSADYDPRQVQASIRLDSFSVGDMLSLIEPFAAVPSLPRPVRAAADDVFVTTEVFLSSGYGNLTYNAPLVAAVYEGLWNIPAEISVSGTNRGVEFYGGRVSLENGTAEINGSVDYSNTNDITFDLGVNLLNLTYFFDGMIRNKRDINIRGSYGFQVYMSTGDDGIYSGYASGDNIPFPSGDRYASLSFLLSVYYGSPSFWQAGLERLEITGLSTPASSSALLRFSAAADERGMIIPDLVFDDGRGALTGNAACNWNTTFDDVRFRTEISGNGRGERLALNGTYRGGRLDLEASAAEMQFSRFTRHNIVAGGSFKLSWESIEDFTAEADISSFVLYRRNDAVRASAAFSMDDETFLAERLKINFAGLEMSVPSFRLSRSESFAETDARLWGMLAEKPVDISLKGNARFNRASTWTDLLRRFEYLDGSLTADTAAFDTIRAEEPFAFTFNSRLEENGYAVNVSGGPRNMLRFTYSPEAAGGGIVYAALSAPSPVRGTITASINAGMIDGQSSDLYADLGSLWRFVPPSAVIAFPGGFVTASVRVTGPLDDPDFYGVARGNSVQVLIPEYLPETIRPVPVTVLLNGNEMTFGPIDVACGSGGGRVSGSFRFDQWIPNIFDIDIEVAEEHPVPYDLDISGVLARGLAWGNMAVKMENMLLHVTGDLTAHDTELSLDMNEFLLPDNGLAAEPVDEEVPVTTDLSIKAGRRAEFFWPSVDLPVIQAYAEMGTGIHLTSDSQSQRFTLAGDVRLRGGEIFYLERNFYIREGTLFLRESETQFAPRISARAEIRDQADIGPVIISMIIDNAPLMSFTPRFTSMPPLSQLEIFSLLGQVPQTEGEQRNLATSVAIDSLAQFTVINRLQRQVRNFLGLDMLSFRTQLLQNMVTQVTGGQSLNNDSNRIGNYFDNSTIFFGKYFGENIFLEGIIPLRYDENQTGWGGVVVEPELGLEMRNPLFDIRFNMLPLNPDTLFIDGVSFSLIWRRSF